MKFSPQFSKKNYFFAYCIKAYGISLPEYYGLLGKFPNAIGSLLICIRTLRHLSSMYVNIDIQIHNLVQPVRFQSS